MVLLSFMHTILSCISFFICHEIVEAAFLVCFIISCWETGPLSCRSLMISKEVWFLKNPIIPVMSFEIFRGNNLVILDLLSTLRSSIFSNLLIWYESTPFEELVILNSSLYRIPGFSSTNFNNSCWTLGKVSKKYKLEELW